MKNLTFKIFSIVCVLIWVGLIIGTIFSQKAINANAESITNTLGPDAVDMLNKVCVYTYIGGSICVSLTLLSLIAVWISEYTHSLSRLFFIPAIIAGMMMVGSLIAIVYVVITIITMIKCEPDVSLFDLFEDEGKEDIPHLITSIVFFVVGLILSLVGIFATFDPAALAWVMWLGMGLLSFSISALVYYAYKPGSEGVIWKIVTPFISLGLLTGLYFLYRFFLFKSVDKFEGDLITIHIAILSCIGTGALLVISYILFYLFKREKKAYFIMLLVSILVSFLAMLIGNLIHVVTWAVIIEAIGWLVSTIFIIAIFAFFGAGNVSGGYYSGSSSDSSDSSDPLAYKSEHSITDENGRERTLTYEGNGNYKDEDGGTWHSDDGGSTVHRS